MNPGDTEGHPLPIFTNLNTIAVVVGIVIGIGIFRLPPIVAANSGSGLEFILFWVAGGVISILGALCYAELAALKPDAGGEYHFLTQGYGSPVGFLFSWGRMTVIQTGSIALAAFILGDYASLIIDLGPYSSAIYAALTIILLTGLNILGTTYSKSAQNIITAIVVSMLIVTALYSLVADISTPSLSGQPGNGAPAGSTMGAAMIFVLLTYGGWNEAAYLSAELKDVRQNMVRVLMIGLSTITLIYVLVNYAYLHILGLEFLQNTEAVGVDMTEQLFGSSGGFIMAIIVIVAALSTANASIITGARTNYALGRDFTLLRFLGKWDKQHNTPQNALIVQGAITLLLVLVGAITKQAVVTMVDYTAPVFWFFLFLTTTTLFIFRRKNNYEDIPYKVPLYPFTPILFMFVSLYMLYSSLAFTGIGALFGVAVLLAGVPIYILTRNRHQEEYESNPSHRK